MIIFYTHFTTTDDCLRKLSQAPLKDNNHSFDKIIEGYTGDIVFIHDKIYRPESCGKEFIDWSSNQWIELTSEIIGCIC